jgi:hypothetical protein
MANFHKNAKEFIDKLTFNTDEIIVEIGSERGEGSTEWFDVYAKKLNVDFYSVDVVDTAKTHLTHLTNTNFVIAESGSHWAHNDLPKLNKKIKVLYLDNYDWLGPINNLLPHEQEQVAEYQNRGIEMSNLNCQTEHLHQMVGCLPFMSNESIIICDDTPYQDHSGIYIGKNGAVIPYLLSYGYKIVFGRGHNRTCLEDNGVILKRSI